MSGHDAVDSGLRERKPSRKANTPRVEDDAPKAVKTFGRTPDGTVFTVPQTHDMVSQLLSPSEPKNLSDLAVLAILGLQILAAYLLPSSVRVPILGAIFLFWRASYNIGIGYLLRVQSDHSRLVYWAKQSGLFEKDSKSWLRALIKRELETKIPKDYSFDTAPIEYNTWLVFRRVVDLILMCDFVSYCLFAIANCRIPPSENWAFTVMRWVVGVSLVGFNIWVKLDAHRVVKDYAWYWGDFFYLIDQELTFDGVFEMAPHPMYSVGYAGYYGISLMAASYHVLFISLVAHAAQFAFLVLVENPHIDKIYKPPKKRRVPGPGDTQVTEESEPPFAPNPLHNIIGLQNMDLWRTTDTSVVLLHVYMFLFAIFTPSTFGFQLFFVINALLWRVWYSVGLGLILNAQSHSKLWTRHFLKYGDELEEAWRQWKGIYHISMNMCYASLLAASWKVYTIPSDWSYRFVLLNHVVGMLLIALQIWTALSIYDSLGEFGWFFGDFFFDHSPKLTYSGIYRYLNNPERVIGLAGVWGLVFITESLPILFLALLSHILTLGFLEYVEKPHMEKLYGLNMRGEAGLTKNLKRTLPPPLVKQLQNRVDKALSDAAEFIEDFVESAGPIVSSRLKTVSTQTRLLSKYPVQITLSSITPGLDGYDPKQYSLDIEYHGQYHMNDKAAVMSSRDKSVPEESSFRAIVLEYGAPIKLRWRSPRTHSKKDWVGLYRVSDNESRLVTGVASRGRWIATTPGVYQSSTSDIGILETDVAIADNDELCEGTVIFEGDKLFWTQGVFEFRYHHNGNHQAMAISLPFEVSISRFDEDDTEGPLKEAVEQALLPVVRNCLDRDDEKAPATADEEFAYLIEENEKFAKRIVYAIKHMFGIEFAHEIVQADGNISKLAWRICNAKKVLAPYSMSTPPGSSTPKSVKY